MFFFPVAFAFYFQFILFLGQTDMKWCFLLLRVFVFLCWVLLMHNLHSTTFHLSWLLKKERQLQPIVVISQKVGGGSSCAHSTVGIRNHCGNFVSVFNSHRQTLDKYSNCIGRGFVCEFCALYASRFFGNRQMVQLNWMKNIQNAKDKGHLCMGASYYYLSVPRNPKAKHTRFFSFSKLKDNILGNSISRLNESCHPQLYGMNLLQWKKTRLLESIIF